MGKLIEFKLQRFFFPFVRLANTRDIKILISKLNVQSYHDSTFFLTTEWKITNFRLKQMKYRT